MSVTITNLATLKARAMQELLFNYPATGLFDPGKHFQRCQIFVVKMLHSLQPHQKNYEQTH
jgi:hypothetical protein